MFHLARPSIQCTDCPGFNRMVGQCVVVPSWPEGTWDSCAVGSSGSRSSDSANEGGSPVVPYKETSWVPTKSSIEDFPLEYSYDTPCSVFYQRLVITLCTLMYIQSYPHFVQGNRLHKMNHNTGEQTTQLLIPKMNQKITFHLVHVNPYPNGHMGYDKTQSQIMARFC